MADIQQIMTHTEDAKDRLLGQYKDAPNINALIDIYGDRIQDIEDILAGFVEGRSIFTAIGVQLDELGKIVRYTRPSGMSDDDYRAALFVQISINTAQGDPKSLVILIKNLTGASIVRYRNLGSAVMTFEIDVDIPIDEIDSLYERVQKACIGGSRVDQIIKITSDSNFSFEGNDGPTTSEGFGDINDPLVGGEWAEILN